MEMNASNIKQNCPKCGGKLFLYNDYHGWYEQCLQCSFILYLDVVYENTAEVETEGTSGINQNTASST